jgi:hypothetical protein
MAALKSENPEKLMITPETKVGEVLDTYPELEELLIEIAPPFRKLHNPVLRKTVARVTSLRQAAKVGGVPIGEMINKLRLALGQETIEVDSDRTSGEGTERPAWLENRPIWKSLDARPLIESGQEPLGMVMTDLSALPPKQLYELIAPFEPAPLIDRARKRGFETYCVHDADGSTRTYFSGER